MFYFRNDEKNTINKFVHSTQKAMAVYGRRRVGKTELLLHMIEQCPDINITYYQCTSFDYSACLKDFINVLDFDSDLDAPVFRSESFREVFIYLSRIGQKRVIIIDEFPFLTKKNNNVSVEFQWIIDHGLGEMQLILLGSNISFMKQQISDTASPLYGRFDQILEIRPFTFHEVRQLFSSFEDAVKVYSATGGIAQYVMFFLKYKTIEQAFDDLYFNRNGRLYAEADNLLLQEFRDVTTYKLILHALGNSKKTGTEIAKECNIDAKGIYSYLEHLKDLEILTTMENAFSKKRGDKKYMIADLYYRFYAAFIDPYQTMITRLGSAARKAILNEQYSEYLGSCYEEIIIDIVYHLSAEGKLHFIPEQASHWWGNACENGNWYETEVDLVLYNKTNVIIGECKYKKKKTGMKELEKLKSKAVFIPYDNRNAVYLLASKSGFTEDLLKSSENVILIEEDRLLNK